MKRWIWILTAVVLAGCTSTLTSLPARHKITGSQPDQVEDQVIAPQISVALDEYGPAPEWQNEIWLNTDAPLRLTELRGQVVLLEMWTFG
jgi:hypothetical protein